MAQAFIDGRPVAVLTAAAEAAKLLAASRLPLVAGLGTDVAGARAAIGLAQRIGGVVDHMHSQALLRTLEVMRQTGTMMTSQSEAALRADTVLLVGPGLAETWPELAARLLVRAPDPRFAALPRRIYWLCPGPRPGLDTAEIAIETIGASPLILPGMLAALRARIAAPPSGTLAVSNGALDKLARGINAAGFGVAVWTAELDSLAIEMLCGIVKDLNATTRFSGLPLWPGDNAMGVLEVCGWMTGLPMRTGFARGVPEHDPWRFEARRLVASGESDCVLWISAYRPLEPEWDCEVPSIVLTSANADFRRRPHVHINVGQPRRDHDGIDWLAATGTLAGFEATHKSAAISVARAIEHIEGALNGATAPPC
jgi:formylmethanofuran dehydrogenase subunit B